MNNLPLNVDNWFESLFSSITAFYKENFKNPAISILEKKLHDLLLTNFKLWKYEDEARRTDLLDKDIAGLKRKIDTDNQKRNNLIDSIDAILQKDIEIKIKTIDNSLPMNSETPGSLFDRLTILAMRIYNLKKETNRKDAKKSHIERCSRMLKEVEERSRDLLKSLKELLEDYYSGRKRLKSYKQHKLYNDPELNPSLRK